MHHARVHGVSPVRPRVTGVECTSGSRGRMWRRGRSGPERDTQRPCMTPPPTPRPPPRSLTRGRSAR
eukprot:1193793-Prymnesium_polylepis.1